jgi:hypothetical protein
VGVDLGALLESLGVSCTWSDAVPHEFVVAVFAYAHLHVLTGAQARALCDLYDADYDLIRAAWEVYCVQSDLDDFVDTLLRVVRDVDLDDLDKLKGTPTTSKVTAEKSVVVESARVANVAVSTAKLDLLKHSLEMMVKQSMLPAAKAAGLFERGLHGDTLIDAAIESYAKDRNVGEFLETLQILGTHSRTEIDEILRSEAGSKTTAEKASNSSPIAKTMAKTTTTSAAADKLRAAEAQVLSTLRTVVTQLHKDALLDEDATGTLLSLIEQGDERIFNTFQTFRYYFIL